MPERDVPLLLMIVLVSIEEVHRYTSGMDCESFIEDDKTIDAVVRNLEIIGEAAHQIPNSFRQCLTSPLVDVQFAPDYDSSQNS